MSIELRRATERDLDAVLLLLAQSGLPQDGLTDHALLTACSTMNAAAHKFVGPAMHDRLIGPWRLAVVRKYGRH